MSSGASIRQDLRRHQRYLVSNGVLRATWLDSGGRTRSADVSVSNISEGGLALELPEAPEPASVIMLRSEKHHMSGSGSVRYCRQGDRKFVVGVKYAAGLRWSPPPDAIGPGPVALSAAAG